MFKTYGVLKNITNKYFIILEEKSKKKKSLNDSDDEMIIRHNNDLINEMKYIKNNIKFNYI